MKNLYLLRHAKSSWSEVGLADRDRPLSGRGLDDAPRMGRRFVDRGESLDRVVASPARRACQTAELFCAEVGLPMDSIEIDDGLYFLGLGSIEAAIRAQPVEIDNLMLVFHNPDITGFVNRLEAGLRIDNMPTCGLVKYTCECQRWPDWTSADCRFEYFDYPKNRDANPITG